MSDIDIPVSTVDRLLLPQSVRSLVMVHLLQCAPNEGVGMLGVHPPVRTENGTEAVAALFKAGRNTEKSPVRYTMDPRDVIKVFREFRELGLHLGAIVHSHLRGPATPSVSDVNEWNYPEALMLIASFAEQPPSLRAWRLVEDKGMAIVQPVLLELVKDP
jgi:[CysO sulfur-carrier protein]-S-L-cysteine hydrolase